MRENISMRCLPRQALLGRFRGICFCCLKKKRINFYCTKITPKNCGLIFTRSRSSEVQCWGVKQFFEHSAERNQMANGTVRSSADEIAKQVGEGGEPSPVTPAQRLCRQPQQHLRPPGLSFPCTGDVSSPLRVHPPDVWRCLFKTLPSVLASSGSTLFF